MEEEKEKEQRKQKGELEKNTDQNNKYNPIAKEEQVQEKKK